MDEAWERRLRLLSTALGGLCVVQLAVWLPFYLAWPWFPDHDVFATLARGWDAGLLPYRDLAANNFPGTIYLFWGLGKVFGWGRVSALYAADAALLIALGGLLAAWSRARFGRALPGWVGYALILSYYLSCDFSLTAQRDWHAAVLVAAGLLAAQTWPGRAGALVAAVGVSAGMLVRPQTVLLVPAVLLAVAEQSRRAGAGRLVILRGMAAWLAVVAALTALGFAPLALAGVLGDFVRGVRLVAYGGEYNRNNLGTIVMLLGDEVFQFKVFSVIACVVVLITSTPRGARRDAAATWLVALAGVLLYKPLSPVTRPYLDHPLTLVWSINAAVLTGLIVHSGFAPKWQALAVLLVLGLGATARPRYCRPGPLRATLTSLRAGREPALAPAGYRRPYHGPWTVPPPWDDYRALLSYLRRETSPSTRVACLLDGVAVTGPTARLPALPAESITWLTMVKPDDEARFVHSLEQTPDSVVVWSPSQTVFEADRRFPLLDSTVRRLYRPSARFGALEVWRRRPSSPSSGSPRPVPSGVP